eukprot:COSAG06_NODE_8604_length_2117_cov_4.480674_1_plen_125_part_10
MGDGMAVPPLLQPGRRRLRLGLLRLLLQLVLLAALVACGGAQSMQEVMAQAEAEKARLIAQHMEALKQQQPAAAGAARDGGSGGGGASGVAGRTPAPSPAKPPAPPAGGGAVRTPPPPPPPPPPP